MNSLDLFDQNQIRDPIPTEKTSPEAHVMNMHEFLTQGARAVRSGRFGEQQMGAAFGSFGVPTVEDNPELHVNEQFWPRAEKILIRQHRLANGRIIDFLYRDFQRKIALPIECKNQIGPGTTDEKLAFTVDMLTKSGYKNFWLVLGGNGFNPSVVTIIQNKIKNLSGVKGHLLFSEPSLLYRAVEALLERGDI